MVYIIFHKNLQLFKILSNHENISIDIIDQIFEKKILKSEFQFRKMSNDSDSSDFPEETPHRKYRICVFTPEDDRIILECKEKHPEMNWTEIAKLIGKKPTQCQNHYRQLVKSKPNHWSPEEIEKLKKNVDEFGPHWKQISRMMAPRTPFECKKMYQAIQDGYRHQEKSIQLKSHEDEASSPLQSVDNLFVDSEVLQLKIPRTPNIYLNENDSNYSFTFMLC